MARERVRDIKHAQRESFFHQEVASFFLRIVQDDARLAGLQITRTKLSPDRGSCTIFFHAPNGLAEFKEKLPTLILYKPSIRASLSKILSTRYTPNLIFRYDTAYEKQERLDSLFHMLKEKGRL